MRETRDGGDTRGGACRDEAGRAMLRSAVLLILLGALPFYVQVLPVFRDALQEYYGIGIRRFGLLISVGLLPGALGALAAGPLVDRFGPEPVVRAGLVGTGAGMLLAAAGSGWGMMLVALSLTSAFWQPLTLAIQVLLAVRFPRSRRRVLSLNLMAGSVAGILFPVAAEYLLSQRATISFGVALRAPFAVVGGVLLLGSLWRGFPRPPAALPPPADPSGTTKEPRVPLSPGSWLLVGLLTLHATADNAVSIWIPRVLGGEGFSERLVAPGAVMSAYALAYVVSRAGLAALPEGVGRRWMLVLPGILGGGVLLAGIVARTQVLLAAGFVAGAFLWSVEYPTFLAAAARSEPRRLGAVLAAATVGAGVGSFVTANVMGSWAGRLPPAELWRILLLPAALFPLVGLGGALWLARHGKTLAE